MKLKKRRENIREYAGPRSRERVTPERSKHRKLGASRTVSAKDIDTKKAEKLKRKEKALSNRGATRSERRAAREPVKWGRFVFLPLFIIAFVAGLSKVQWDDVYDRAYAATNRPLAHIKIESEFRYVNKDSLQGIVSEKLDGSFVDLDLQDVKTSIEANPWIQEVMIERIWPDTLKLKIVEHKPIARWRNDGFISRKGVLIKVESNEMLSALPLLSGADNDSAEVSKNYLVFSELLKSSELQVSGLVLDEKLAWTITLAQGFTLVLGRGDIHGRLENFRYVYDRHLKSEKDRLARVDMRYEKGLAVSWKGEAKQDEKLVAASAAR